MAKKGALSKSVRYFREGVKHISAKGAAKVFGSRSFPIFGLPSGLTDGLDGGVQKLSYPSTPFTMHPPQTLDPKLYWKFEAMLHGMAYPEAGVLTLKNATATSKGGNLSSRGKLVTTFLQPIDGKPPDQNDLFRFSTKRFFPRIYHADYPVVTLAAGWQGAFYHWVYEVLPRLHLVEKESYCINKIYVEAAFRFQKESLELLEITQDRMINAHIFDAVWAPELIVPCIPLIPSLWSCGFLREKILPKLSRRPPLRLYVSRNDAQRRRILNEDAVMGVLKKYGFEKAILSELSFKEQAELFHAAQAVVGPHGAGFSHLVFCHPGTPVLEIFSPAYVCPCYWHVSDCVQLSYHYLFGEGETYPDKIESGLDPDIIVDLTKLEASLKLMGCT